MAKVSLKPRATASLSLSTPSHYQLSVSCSVAVKTNPHPPSLLFGPLSTPCVLTSCDEAGPSLVPRWQLTVRVSARCEICALVSDASRTAATHKTNYKAFDDETDQQNRASKSIQLGKKDTKINTYASKTDLSYAYQTQRPVKMCCFLSVSNRHYQAPKTELFETVFIPHVTLTAYFFNAVWESAMSGA